MSFIEIDVNQFGKDVQDIINGFKKKYEITDTDLSVVAETIRENITENVLNSESIDGGQVLKNAPATVKFKGFQRPLYHTGGLAGSIKKRKISGGYEVYISNKKSLSGLPYNQVGYNLQYGWQGDSKFVKPLGKKKYATHTANIRVPARPFFGISERLDNDIDAVLENLFNKK